MKASNLDNPVNSMMRKPMTKKDLMQSDKLRSDDCDKDLSPKKQKVNSGQRKLLPGLNKGQIISE